MICPWAIAFGGNRICYAKSRTRELPGPAHVRGDRTKEGMHRNTTAVRESNALKHQLEEYFRGQTRGVESRRRSTCQLSSTEIHMLLSESFVHDGISNHSPFVYSDTQYNALNLFNVYRCWQDDVK